MSDRKCNISLRTNPDNLKFCIIYANLMRLLESVLSLLKGVRIMF